MYMANTEDNQFGVCFAVTTNLFNILKKRSIYHTKEYPYNITGQDYEHK